MSNTVLTSMVLKEELLCTIISYFFQCNTDISNLYLSWFYSSSQRKSIGKTKCMGKKKTKTFYQAWFSWRRWRTRVSHWVLLMPSGLKKKKIQPFLIHPVKEIKVLFHRALFLGSQLDHYLPPFSSSFLRCFHLELPSLFFVSVFFQIWLYLFQHSRINSWSHFTWLQAPN